MIKILLADDEIEARDNISTGPPTAWSWWAPQATGKRRCK